MTTSYAVEGLTCGHCVSAVTTELSVLAGVQQVEVDLVAGGVSTVRVTSGRVLAPEAVAAALEEAGDYRLTSAV
jgi:copper chaperone CopZ